MQVGDTVSLRVVTTETGPGAAPGAATEVVGVVLAASPDALTVRRRDGRVIDVTRASITAGRVVPPSPAQRVDPVELERIASRGWLALEQEPLGDWILRASGGVTRRANSALAVGHPGLPLPAAVQAVLRWYDARGLPARVQLPRPGGTDGLATLLLTAGWDASPVTHVLTAELGPVLRAAGEADRNVEIRLDEEPDDAWLAAWRLDAGEPPAAARDLLANHPQAVFASVREGSRCVAIARAAVDERWTGLFAVEVAADRRRTGLGRAVSAAALRWAVSHGARRCYLQVTDDNVAARTLYERLGFTVHHDYRYFSRSTDRGK